MAKKRRKPRPRRSPQPVRTAEQATPAPAPKPQRRRQIEDERPSAPWGSFPLVEIVVAVALIMLAVGFFVEGSQGSTLLITGIALGALAGLELSIREHFSGYRSHTTLLAAAAGIATLAILSFAAGDAISVAVSAGIAVAVGGLVAIALVRAFRARSGRSIKLR
jgi:FtsH-binding integral membrane protein